MKKQIIKHGIVLAVALVLLITASVLTLGTGKVSAGAGNGTDAKIMSIEDMSQLLQSFSARVPGEKEEPVAKTSVRLSDTESSAYTSVTMEEISTWELEFSESVEDRYGDRKMDSHSVKMDRTLKVYMTENVSYYVSDFDFVQSSKSEDGETKLSQNEYSSCKIEVYLAEDAAMIRMDRCSAETNGVLSKNINKFTGKWIDLMSAEEIGLSADEAVEMMTAINAANYNILSLMGDFISEREGFTSSDDTVFTMKKDTFDAFLRALLILMGEKSLIGDTEGEFVVDLHQANVPKVYFDLYNSYSDSKRSEFVQTPGGSGYYTPSQNVSLKFNEKDDFTFYNINNTVIGDPPHADLTVKELFEIMEEM